MRATGKKIWDSSNTYYINYSRNIENKYTIYSRNGENLGQYKFKLISHNIWKVTSGTVTFLFPTRKKKIVLPTWF